MAAVQISVLQANLTTTCLESLLYGLFLMLAVTSILLLAHRRLQAVGPEARTKSACYRALATPMIIGTVCLFLGNTMPHWVITVMRLFQAFVYYKGGKEATAFYIDMAQPTNVALTAAMMFCIAVGDAMVVYRLWVVWGYNFHIAALPSLGLLGIIVCGVGATYETSRLQHNASIFSMTMSHWVTGSVICTLVANVYSTAGIIIRIWGVNTARRHYGMESLTGVLVVLIESAALYTVWVLFYFVSYQAGSELQNVAVECISAVAGIALTSLNVRVGMGWTTGGHEGVKVSEGERRPDVGDANAMASAIVFVAASQRTTNDYEEASVHPEEDKTGLGLAP